MLKNTRLMPAQIMQPLAALLAAAALLAFSLAAPARAEEGKVKVVALGTSLTAGYGLEQAEGFVPQLQAALEAKGLDVEVENAGVSGDTSAGGLARLDWSIDDDVDAVIVELGSNDALRGFDPQQTRDNLTAILEALAARDLPVLLTGMLAPPNLGEEYGTEFAAIYPDLASRYGVLFYPFFLEGVAADAALNQPDGIHPNADGVQVIVEAITPYAVQLVEHARKDTSS
ncbi:arylesterase [Pyruvatibacter mobilis]|uniref:arylesterase n=1 Tax=Pyruvatibacter mobilis TaxID=1712261 RepID=UPI003BA8D198